MLVFLEFHHTCTSKPCVCHNKTLGTSEVILEMQKCLLKINQNDFLSISCTFRLGKQFKKHCAMHDRNSNTSNCNSKGLGLQPSQCESRASCRERSGKVLLWVSWSQLPWWQSLLWLSWRDVHCWPLSIAWCACPRPIPCKVEGGRSRDGAASKDGAALLGQHS